MIYKRLIDLSADEKAHILNRGAKIDIALVTEIVERVKHVGDRALKEYTEKFDGVALENLKVSEDEFDEAFENASPEVIEAIEKAHSNILKFHEKQIREDYSYTDSNRELGYIFRPVERAGCYVPGGRAFYPSTVLMAATPARVAGVKQIVCITPPQSNGKINEHTLTACKIAGVTEVYKLGGVQGIAALAYGTETIQKTDIIVGPGNKFVTAAKKLVYGDVGVDMLAGPSEILIIADRSTNPEYVYSDILAQAEHDPDASCVLLAIDENLAKKVHNQLNRNEDVASSLKNTSILTVKSVEEAIEFSNLYAPEHLAIIVENHEEVLKKIVSAGSVFIGPFSPVAAGDYASGTNHILPTGGCARYQSGLGIDHFIKRISVQTISRKGLEEIGDTITTLAEAEGLKYHSESVNKRLKR